MKDRKPLGYWPTWSNVEKELNVYILKHGRFPTNKELKASGLEAVANAILRYHGGYYPVRLRMGFKPEGRPWGFWQQWPNVERLLRVSIRKLHRFPTSEDLVKCGQGSLCVAISKYYGGFSVVRTRMGFDLNVKPKGHWQLWRNVMRAIRAFVAKHHKFPTAKGLRAAGLSGLASAITKYHGGFLVVRARMGFGKIDFQRGHWSPWPNVEKTIRGFIAKNGNFPTRLDLCHCGLFSLMTAITRYHGGFPAVRARLGYTPVNADQLKLHADALVHVLFALQKKLPGIKSDTLWDAITKRWHAPDLERALKKAKKGDLGPFCQILAH